MAMTQPVASVVDRAVTGGPTGTGAEPSEHAYDESNTDGHRPSPLWR
jgi:hypothetical protein